MAQIAEIKASINAAQEVIGWDVIFNVERVKQSLVRSTIVPSCCEFSRWPMI